jgi:integrase
VLYRWLEEEQEIPVSPMADQPVPVVPEDRLRRLLATCAGKDFEARRDTAIVMFLLDIGARRAELADLQLGDLDLDLDVALVWARVGGSVPCPTAARPPWPWTATCVSAPDTRTPIFPGYGLASVVG